MKLNLSSAFSYPAGKHNGRDLYKTVVEAFVSYYIYPFQEYKWQLTMN